MSYVVKTTNPRPVYLVGIDPCCPRAEEDHYDPPIGHDYDTDGTLSRSTNAEAAVQMSQDDAVRWASYLNSQERIPRWTVEEISD